MRIPGDHFWRNSEQRLVSGRYISFTALVAIALVAVAVTLPPAIASVRTAIDGWSTGPATKVAPASARGLLYTVTGDERSAIFIQSDSGSRSPRQIIHGDGQQAAGLASPDGANILFLAAACPRCSAAYLLDVVGTGTTRIIGSGPGRITYAGARIDANWSADGRRVAFVENGPDAPSGRIFLLDVDSGDRRALVANGVEQQTNPVWSPSAGSVAYLAGGKSSIVMVTNLEGGETRALNDQLDHASDLAWSPDGRYLSVLRNGELWLIATGDGRGFKLDVPGNVQSFGGWAPDSRSVTVAAGGPLAPDNGADRVLVVPVDGGPVTSIIAHASVGDVRWSPDGRTIAWTSNGVDRWGIWSASSTGGAARQIASGTGAVTFDSWR